MRSDDFRFLMCEQDWFDEGAAIFEGVLFVFVLWTEEYIRVFFTILSS